MPSRKPTKAEEATPIIHIGPEHEQIVIDEQTGEILEWPKGVPRNMTTLLERGMYAEEAEKAWAQAGRAYKAAIKRELDEAGIRKVVGGPGRAQIIGGLNEYAPGGLRLAQWLRDHEPPPDFYRSLPQAIQALQPAVWRAVCELYGYDEKAAESLVDATPFEYVRYYRDTPAPPAIARHPRED